MEHVFIEAGGVTSSLINFQQNFNSSNEKTYSTPWDNTSFEGYNSTVRFGHVVLVELFADGATLFKSGTQSAKFVRMRFANIKWYWEKWFDMGTAPIQKHFQWYLRDARKRRLKSLLYHRFLFQLAQNLISASYTGSVVNDQTLVPRVSIFIADQPEERMLFSLKDHHRFMDWSVCQIPSQIVNRTDSFLSDDENETINHRPRSSINRLGQLSTQMYPRRSVSSTIENDLKMAQQKYWGAQLSGQ